MKVFLAVKSLLPSYGGPAFSVSQLARALAKAGLEVAVWASDMSAVESLLSPSRSLRTLTGSVVDALGQCGQVDVLHDNGIWLPHNHHLARLAAEQGLVRVVSTRGMLEPWARNHKRWKKKFAWWLYQRRDLCCASYHHATSIAEAESLRTLQLGVPVSVIPNGVEIANGDPRRRKRSDIRTALFVGRIHPVKGLALLIEAWAKLRPRSWQLQIAGPDEIGYRHELERKVSGASLSDVVHFLGSLNDEAKEQTFANADLFVLPSFSESFGMVIGEALAHGVPVLTTTAAPWPMIEGRGCGWSVIPTVDGITAGLRVAISSNPTTLKAMGENGREFIRQDYAWPKVAKQFIDTYEALLMQKSLV
jgi:glycosyltransferase involved in cell wall biosynthesis